MTNDETSLMRHDDLQCPECLERLPLYVGEDLEPLGHAAVARHLERCPTCRAQAARAGAARDRLRGVLDASLRSTSRAGLWPGVRARLVEEGLLGAGDERQARPAPAVPATTATDAAPTAPRAFRGLRLLAPLAAAAALLVTLFAGDPFGRGEAPAGALADGRPAAQAVPVVPVAAAGGLRRLAAGEPTLTQDARPLLRDGQLVPEGARALPGTTLVHYR